SEDKWENIYKKFSKSLRTSGLIGDFLREEAAPALVPGPKKCYNKMLQLSAPPPLLGEYARKGRTKIHPGRTTWNGLPPPSRRRTLTASFLFAGKSPPSALPGPSSPWPL